MFISNNIVKFQLEPYIYRNIQWSNHPWCQYMFRWKRVSQAKSFPITNLANTQKGNCSHISSSLKNVWRWIETGKKFHSLIKHSWDGLSLPLHSFEKIRSLKKLYYEMKLVPHIGYDVKDGVFSYIFFDENRTIYYDQSKLIAYSIGSFNLGKFENNLPWKLHFILYNIFW